jgi:hypothetical protein
MRGRIDIGASDELDPQCVYNPRLVVVGKPIDEYRDRIVGLSTVAGAPCQRNFSIAIGIASYAAGPTLRAACC